MNGIQIIATGKALPESGYDNNRLSTMVDTTDEWIRTRTGIGHRYICQKESCVSLAVEAARHALKGHSDLREKIGAVIVATSTGDYIFPSVACMAAKQLNLRKDLLAFDLGAACSGFLYGMEVSRNFLASHPDEYVLLIGAEQLSRIVDYTDRGICILFGDGAGAALLGYSEKKYLHHSGCDGNEEVLSCRGAGFDQACIQMKGNAVFRFAVTTLQENIDHLLEELDLSIKEIDYVICHQANARIIDHVRKKYPGAEKKFCMNLEQYGNTSAASIPILMHEMYEQGKLQTGMKIICVGFGAGLTWGGTYMEI